MSSDPSSLPSAAATNVLGFDVGHRRIGIALGNTLSGAARPLAVLERNGEFWHRLDAMVADWRPARLVVGEPLTLDGAEQEATRVARAFARQAGQRYGVPIVLVDERSSSKEADRRFAAARAAGAARRRDALLHDARAAEVILDRWFMAGMPAA